MVTDGSTPLDMGRVARWKGRGSNEIRPVNSAEESPR